MNVLNIYLKIKIMAGTKMIISRKGISKTYTKLLQAASEVFAEKGYRDATIADICNRAGVNIAAVNYHFGDKETLYKEAWRYSFLKSIKAHPPDGSVSDDAPPKERLRGMVTALLRRIADENNKEFLLVQKELANPTGLLEEVMREEIWPIHEKLEALVRELAGPYASDTKVRFCAISIISQCINPMVARNRQKEKKEGKDAQPGIFDIEDYANHVVRFSLAGISAISDEVEKG
ncbi:MAG TPA: CerR family C-terminal domain-containing protein [Syntrophorhabdaceae bacterium]|nr:CerR family C-terminal domain-containing protein [Syntrophorhabdaceae bacterium]